MEFTENNEVIDQHAYRAILVGVQMNQDISYYMKELEGLAEAAEIEVLGQMIQNRERPGSRFYIGKGKVEELAEMCANMDANVVIFNNELSGIQLRNLEDSLGITVLDRTILILDIFAKRAVTKEGKLQVELAQLQYRLPRLLGFGKSLSRTGAGIGTRGPGEKKLETDRRHISKKMDEIRREIEENRQTRATQRSSREKSEIPIVALVGYTNAGKSAIMNQILKTFEKEEKIVFEENMLFATLDTFQRSIKLDTNHEFILVDTVGFVSKLPHTLIKAFKATLEEVTFADLLLHVVDCSYEDYPFYMDVTEQVLKEIGVGDKETIILYNKVDLVQNPEFLMPEQQNSLYISAKTGYNMDKLLQLIKDTVFTDFTEKLLLIPYDKGSISSYLYEKCNVIEMDYREKGTFFRVELSSADAQRLKEYEIEDGDGL